MIKEYIPPYLKVMRLDHYHKNVIVIAGMAAFLKLESYGYGGKYPPLS